MRARPRTCVWLRMARQRMNLTAAMTDTSSEKQGEASLEFDLAMLTDLGTNRKNNEDCCSQFVEAHDSVVFAVADGVGGYEGGEIASATGVETLLQTYRDNPKAWGASRRLHRAIQNANIEIYNRALVVPELRRMATTMTAVSVERGVLAAAHVGDCRLYLARDGNITQMTKDHTVVGEKVRMGLLAPERARTHPDRSKLTRSLGQELIASVDLISMPLRFKDVLVLCSDGLHNVILEPEILKIAGNSTPSDACRTLIDTANERGTPDNLTVAVFKMLAPYEAQDEAPGWRDRLRNLLGRRG